MGDEYVNIKDVINIAAQYCPDDDGSCSKADVDLREMLDEIEALPAADVQPARFARWIDLDNRILCSGCGAGYDDSDEVKQNTYIFCPNCGARMDGDTNG